ncbi:MAG: hypothetical protein NTZ78_10875 [Candidatus Aureabacteria bacterium]|nr:hypothetical protein [Candidatus Auribacterota bacterium]
MHLNPVRLRRFKGVPFEEKVRTLEQYPWSSYSAYIGRQEIPFLYKDIVLGMIGGNGRERYRLYREFALIGLRQGIKNPLREKKAQAVLGDDRFIARVYEEQVKGREDEKEYSKVGEIVPEQSIERIASEVAREFGLKPEFLLQRYMRGPARQALVELSCRHAGARLGMHGVAKILGVSVAALHLSRRRLRQRMREDKGLIQRIEKIETILRK